MIGEILSALNLIEKTGKFFAWVRKKRERPVETVAARFIRLFESHDVHRNQIPRFFGRGLSLKDVQDEASLLHKLDDPMLDAACDLFGVRREWLDGAEPQVYSCRDFYKQPAEVAPFISALKTGNPKGSLDGVLLAPETLKGDAVILLWEIVGWVGDKAIYRCHLLDNWLYDYWKSRAYLAACVAILWKNGVYIRGAYSPGKEIKRIARGEILLGNHDAGRTASKKGQFHPEDMALRPDAFLTGINSSSMLEITSALELWLHLEEGGYMATGLAMYRREEIRQPFEKERDRFLVRAGVMAAGPHHAIESGDETIESAPVWTRMPLEPQGKQMKICDFAFQFETNRGNKPRGLCRVRIFHSSTGIVSVLTDLSNVGHGAMGPSVTNSVEFIRSALIKRGFITHDTLVIEHYEKESFREATFDVVSFSQENIPRWKSISIDEACNLLDCDESELSEPTELNSLLISEIERLRNDIDPFSGSPYPESPQVVSRRISIEEKMVKKNVLISAIEAGAGERELQRILKCDLSLIAEIYADPDDEYICFSEFPVGDGFVDFAIFTGRSRMDVILIEIKGADFNLINGNSYENFSSKANEAIQQIRTRIGFAYRNMEEFRKEVHKIRLQAEAGKSIYGAFVGPYSKLEVDPNKDINIRSIVIAGRTKDDLEESRLRHDYEWVMKPSVKIETWDSWIKKLRRL